MEQEHRDRMRDLEDLAKKVWELSQKSESGLPIEDDLCNVLSCAEELHGKRYERVETTSKRSHVRLD